MVTSLSHDQWGSFCFFFWFVSLHAALRNFGKRFLPTDKAEADVLATKDDSGGTGTGIMNGYIGYSRNIANQQMGGIVDVGVYVCIYIHTQMHWDMYIYPCIYIYTQMQ